MLSLQNAGKRFGPRVLFLEANWLIRANEKTALVGANGTGKSTLMKVLAGIESLDYGSLQQTRGMSIGYLPQEGLRLTGRTVRRPDRCVATVDHNVPTLLAERFNILDQIAAKQISTLRENCKEFGIELYDIGSREQGIVHVIGPELGITKPGMTIVCGDSHTSTHGAFGALAFGIGTSEVEHVLATQTLPQGKPKTFRIAVEGELPKGVTAKDIVLAIIGEIGTDGATGCVIEYAGSAIRALSMEGRMTICNMSIEAGARAGMIAPDETTFAYLKGRRYSPQGAAWDAAVAEWSKLPTDQIGRAHV